MALPIVRALLIVSALFLFDSETTTKPSFVCGVIE